MMMSRTTRSAGRLCVPADQMHFVSLYLIRSFLTPGNCWRPVLPQSPGNHTAFRRMLAAWFIAYIIIACSEQTGILTYRCCRQAFCQVVTDCKLGSRHRSSRSFLAKGRVVRWAGDCCPRFHQPVQGRRPDALCAGADKSRSASAGRKQGLQSRNNALVQHVCGGSAAMSGLSDSVEIHHRRLSTSVVTLRGLRP